MDQLDRLNGALPAPARRQRPLLDGGHKVVIRSVWSSYIDNANAALSENCSSAAKMRIVRLASRTPSRRASSPQRPGDASKAGRPALRHASAGPGHRFAKAQLPSLVQAVASGFAFMPCSPPATTGKCSPCGNIAGQKTPGPQMVKTPTRASIRNKRDSRLGNRPLRSGSAHARLSGCHRGRFFITRRNRSGSKAAGGERHPLCLRSRVIARWSSTSAFSLPGDAGLNSVDFRRFGRRE